MPAGSRAIAKLFAWGAAGGLILLAATAVNQYESAVMSSREAVLKENLRITRNAIYQYREHWGRYPANLEALVDDRYLRDYPVDPVTCSSATWILIGESTCSPDGHTEGGVFDLRSGADGTSTDGSGFSDW